MAHLVNVCGSSRSGTTMLDVMLGNASDAFSCGEVIEWFRPTRTHAFEIEYLHPEHTCKVWKKIKHFPESQFHSAVINELKVDYVIDSSKNVCWLIDTQTWASAYNLKCFNLLLWKDPITMAYSRWKRGDYDLTHWRNGFIKYYSKIFEVELPFIAINYNELVSRPSEMLADICTVIGMTYFEGKERFWKKRHCHLFGSLGVRRQIEAGKSMIQANTLFPPEFEAHFETLQNQISSDSRLQKILENLMMFDISLFVDKGIVSHQFQPKKLYPWWYYGKKIRRSLKRHFPEVYDPYAREKIETIPDKDIG